MYDALNPSMQTESNLLLLNVYSLNSWYTLTPYWLKVGRSKKYFLLKQIKRIHRRLVGMALDGNMPSAVYARTHARFHDQMFVGMFVSSYRGCDFQVLCGQKWGTVPFLSEYIEWDGQCRDLMFGESGWGWCFCSQSRLQAALTCRRQWSWTSGFGLTLVPPLVTPHSGVDSSHHPSTSVWRPA